jgi:hypothetical protein
VLGTLCDLWEHDPSLVRNRRGFGLSINSIKEIYPVGRGSNYRVGLGTERNAMAH